VVSTARSVIIAEATAIEQGEVPSDAAALTHWRDGSNDVELRASKGKLWWNGIQRPWPRCSPRSDWPATLSRSFSTFVDRVPTRRCAGVGEQLPLPYEYALA